MTRTPVGIDWTTIGRPIDLRVSTNLAIVVVSVLTWLSVALAHALLGRVWHQAIQAGLAAAMATFLAWAFARELDPDRQASAFLAAAGGLASNLLLGNPHLVLLLWFMMAIRFINQSTGSPPGILDYGGFYGIKLWLGGATHWSLPLLALPTVLLSDLDRFPRWIRIALPAALPLATIAFGLLRGWHLRLPSIPQTETAVLAIILIGTVPIILSYRTVRAVGDQSGTPLRPHRVQWGIGWAAAAGVVLLLTGGVSLGDLGPLWAALAGAEIGWLVQTLRK